MNLDDREQAPATHRFNVADFEGSASREWLVTNGLGGYAAGTVGDATTRRYHGLLVAALRPPVERTVLVAKFGARVRYGGSEFSLDSNQYADGTINPTGYQYLESFRLDLQIPTWTWTLADALLVRRVWMKHGENTTFISYTLNRASDAMEMEIEPLCTGRDYHWHAGEHMGPNVRLITGGCEIGGFDGVPAYRITANRGGFHCQPDWHRNLRHREEARRGLDDREDLFRPGVFRLTLIPGDSVVFACSTDATEAITGKSALAAERRRIEQLGDTTDRAAPAWIRQLVYASDQFIVERKGSNGESGASVIAGGQAIEKPGFSSA